MYLCFYSNSKKENSIQFIFNLILFTTAAAARNDFIYPRSGFQSSQISFGRRQHKNEPKYFSMTKIPRRRRFSHMGNVFGNLEMFVPFSDDLSDDKYAPVQTELLRKTRNPEAISKPNEEYNNGKNAVVTNTSLRTILSPNLYSGDNRDEIWNPQKSNVFKRETNQPQRTHQDRNLELINKHNKLLQRLMDTIHKSRNSLEKLGNIPHEAFKERLDDKLISSTTFTTSKIISTPLTTSKIIATPFTTSKIIATPSTTSENPPDDDKEKLTKHKHKHVSAILTWMALCIISLCILGLLCQLYVVFIANMNREGYTILQQENSSPPVPICIKWVRYLYKKLGFDREQIRANLTKDFLRFSSKIEEAVERLPEVDAQTLIRKYSSREHCQMLRKELFGIDD